ncbi:MAG: hypothetical protein WEC33_02665 [Dehalococcoidia bacterium]
MTAYGSVRATALGFGLTYLTGGVLLAELVGSSADSTATFTTHFDDDAARFGDIAGSLLLMVSSVFVLCAGLTLRERLRGPRATLRVDLVAALAFLGAAALFVSAGLLLSAPLLQSFGDLVDDPGMEPAVAAGFAQAGTIALISSVLLLGAWTALVAHVAHSAGAIGRWFRLTGWVVAGLTVFAVTGIAAFPLGVWWVALAFGWRPAREQTSS